MPASRGRALPFEKISSNIFVEVAGEEKVKKAASESTKADGVKSSVKKVDKSAEKEKK